MSKGDTTVHVDFEVGGASAAKMTVMDFYRANQAAASKLNEAARALSKQEGISFSDAKKAIKDLLRAQEKAITEAAAANKKANDQGAAEELKREAAAASLRKQRTRAIEKILDEERRANRRTEEKAVDDARWAAREKLKESRRVAREKERDLKAEMSQRGAMGKLMGRGILGAAMGVAGYAGVAGVSNIISGAVSGVNEFVDKRADLERAAAPLMALGDNVGNMKSIRAEIVGIGASLGRSNEEVIGFLESMDSISGSMSAEKMREVKKESMELSELFGTDLQTAMRLLAKTQITYGDSFESMNQAQTKMLIIQDKSDISFNDMALRMPELMANAKPLGITFDEVGASIMATTQALGSAENALTGTRNAIMIIQDAEKEGIHLTGSLTEKLNQLYVAAQNGDQVLMELFKRDPLAAGATMVDKRKEIQAYVKELESVSAKEDPAADKIAQKFEDPIYKGARLRDLDKALIENAPNIAADLNINNEITRAMERFRAGKVAGGVASGGMFGVGTAAGVLAMLGDDKMVDAGNKIRLSYLTEGSGLREDLVRQRVQYGAGGFEEKRQADLSALGYDHRAAAKFGDYFGLDMRSEEMKAIENRPFDTSAAYSNQPSLEKRLSGELQVAGVSESNALLREIRDAVLPRSFMPTVKPGGGTTNNSELL